jgi:hypothetical protein
MRDNFDGNPDWPQVRGLSFDQDHEGHWGWRVDAVLANIRNWMLTYPVPTVVLIHLGTNDCAQAQSVSSTVVELSQLVAAVRERAPRTTILLAKLIPAALTLSITSCITALNERIGVLAQQLSTSASAVHLVDQHTGFDASIDTWDRVHPNDQGAVKMANKWFEALEQAVGAQSSTQLSNSASCLAPSLLFHLWIAAFVVIGLPRCWECDWWLHLSIASAFIYRMR